MRTHSILLLVGLLAAVPLSGEDQAPPEPPAEEPEPAPSDSPPPRPDPRTSAPAPSFTPSEKIKADQSVAFPVDI